MKKSLFIYLCLSMAISTGVFCQSFQFQKYDLKKKRLLIKMTGVYIYSVNQGNIDIDSAMILACKANKIPVALSYDEIFYDEINFPGSEMVDNNDITSAQKILKKTQKGDKIKLLLKLGSYYLFKSGSKKEDLQKSLYFIKQAIELSNQLKIPKWQLQSNILLGKYYFQEGNLTQSQELFSKLVQTCRKLNDKKKLANALENQGTFLLDSNPEKEGILLEAMLLYKETNEETKEVETLTKLVSFHFWNGNLDLAKKQSIDAYNLLKKINFKHTHYNAATIAYIDMLQKNQKEALFYALDGVKSMEATQDYGLADNFYLHLASIYNQMGNIEESLLLYKKSIIIGQKSEISKSWYKSILSYTAGLAQLGKYKEALEYLAKTTKQYPPDNALDKIFIANTLATSYQKLGDLKNAQKNYAIVDQYAPKIITAQNAFDIVKIYAEMSLFYASLTDQKRAKLYADKVVTTTNDYNIKFNYHLYDLALFKIDSLSGNYIAAIKNYQKFKSSNDSLINNSKRKEIEELRIKYETSQNEQNIKTLKIQTNLQQSRLEKSKLTIRLSIGLLLLSLIITGLLYKFYLLKIKNHKKLERKEKEINIKNKNLQHLLDEKEWLMKEIHHRVKNNLQTVISLLNSQSAYVDNDSALSTIKSSQHRIYAMSLIHQKLYMHDTISTINISVYINELVDYLKDAFQLKQHISFKIAIEQLELDVVQAIPLGLIINEAVTNALKYAFKENQGNVISISLNKTDFNQYLLVIQDNGIGINPELNKKNHSFGMTLMKGLSDDLEGTFSIENNNGTLLQLFFKKTNRSMLKNF